MNLMRQVLTILMLLGLAVGSPVAAAASVSHSLAHVSQPVAADQHHHHEADGTVDMHGDDDADDQKRDGLGHSHGLISVDLASIPEQVSGLSSAYGRIVVEPGQAQPLTAIAPPQEKRPPRTA